MISLKASKYLFAKDLFNDINGNNMELLKNEELEHIQDKFIELNSHNLVASFKHHPRGGYINNILELNFRNHYNYI
jgi:phosphoribosylformylglycinamidine (FGAM) synthase-like enzyme